MMDSETTVLRTDLQNYIPLIASGKVRELYELDKSTLLFVTTDRISGMMSSICQLSTEFRHSIRCGIEECEAS